MEVSPFLCSCRGSYWKRAFSQLELRSSEVPFLLNVQETTKPQYKMKRGSTRGWDGAAARCGGEGSQGKVSPPALAGLPRSVGSIPCWGSVTPSGWARGFGAAADRGFGIVAHPGWSWSGTGLSFTSLCGIILSGLVWCWGNFSCLLLLQTSRWRVLLGMVLQSLSPIRRCNPGRPSPVCYWKVVTGKPCSAELSWGGEEPARGLGAALSHLSWERGCGRCPCLGQVAWLVMAAMRHRDIARR